MEVFFFVKDTSYIYKDIFTIIPTQGFEPGRSFLSSTGKRSINYGHMEAWLEIVYTAGLEDEQGERWDLFTAKLRRGHIRILEKQ